MSMPMPSKPSTAAPERKRGAIIVKASVRPAGIAILSLAAVLVIVQLVNMFVSYRLDAYGIEPRSAHGLIGIAAAPFIHGSWGHLASNIVPLVILGFLVLAAGFRQGIAVTVLIWLISGFGVWLIGPADSVMIGASGIVFGWLAYLVVRGAFNRSIGQILVGLLLLAIWGSVFWTGIVSVAFANVFGAVGISWQGHLFGAIGGVVAALLVSRADAPGRKPASALTA